MRKYWQFFLQRNGHQIYLCNNMSTIGGGVNIVTDGLVLYLDAANTKSYPGSGTAWSDLSRSGNNGVLTNGPTFNSGNGGSIVFDGTNDYAQTTSNPIANDSSFTLETWVNFTNFNNSLFRPIIDCGNLGVGSLGYCLAKNTSNNLYLAINTGFVGISNTITNNIWYHIVATASKTANYTMSIYLNSVLGTVNASAITSVLTNSQTSIRLMSNYVGTVLYSQGNIGITRIYNKALTPQEIQQNYNATKSRYGL